MSNKQKQHRMGWVGISGLLVVGIILDLVTLIPGAGTLLAPPVWIAINTYLWIIGCGIVNAKRLSTSLISMVGEMIPALQALPINILGIIAIIIMVRLEDKTGIKVHGGTKGVGNISIVNGNPVRNPKITPPLNVDGIRLPPQQ